jgi:hypothetical protein
MKTISIIFGLIVSISALSQNKTITENNQVNFLTTVTDTNITSLVQNTLIGDYLNAFNITSNVSLNTNTAIGNFYNYNTPNFQLDSGIVFCTGDIYIINNENNQSGATTTVGSGTDADLQILLGSQYSINDAVVIEFDYIPYTNLINFSYIFGSEEFPEFVNSSFNDVFGFFVSGPGINGQFTNSAINIALMPDSSGNVSIDNIYSTPYYIDNENDTIIEYDGYTTALDAVLEVTPFMVYHIKLAVGDAGDSAYDTGVFLKNNSFSSLPLQYYVNTVNINGASKTNLPEAIEDSVTLTIDIELPTVATTDITYSYQILGTAINGVDYEQIADSIVIPADSNHASILINALADSIIEGTEQIILVLDYLNDTIAIDILDNTKIISEINTSENTEYKLYPNPANNNVTIESTEYINSIEILSVTGDCIKQLTAKQLNNLTIDISTLRKGVYFVKVNNNKTVKFVKN